MQAIINAIGSANDRACQQVLNREENIADDNEAQTLLAVLNAFRDYIKPEGVITTGEHFNIQLLTETFKLYDRNYDIFGGFGSNKNNLCW